METKTPPITDMQNCRDFELLKEMILKRLGLQCDFYRDSYLQRRISFRMKKVGIASYRNYTSLLRTNPEEYAQLIRDITVNYTKFFRDSDVFLFFQKVILPELLATKKAIRLLSAGCSSGEEPYTISMISREVLGPKINEYGISIFAVDIDDGVLAKATAGIYKPEEVAGISKAYLDKYFKLENNKYQVKEEVKRHIHYKRLDLTQPLTFRGLDVIFCRNVFIYFNKSGQAKIFENFFDALQNGAYLIIGKSETLPEEVRSKFACVDARCKVFKKTQPANLKSLTIGAFEPALKNQTVSE